MKKRVRSIVEVKKSMVVDEGGVKQQLHLTYKLLSFLNNKIDLGTLIQQNYPWKVLIPTIRIVSHHIYTFFGKLLWPPISCLLINHSTSVNRLNAVYAVG